MTAPRSATYPTRFGEGWIAFESNRIVATGLPGAPNPYPAVQSPPDAVRALAEGLSQFWQGGELPNDRDIIEAGSRTDLDRAIYTTVAAIPAGQTKTYQQVAEAVGRPGAARAVGAAMAANRFAPIIPCHRVVGSDGTLRGYAGGLDMKQYLLDMEAGAVG